MGRPRYAWDGYDVGGEFVRLVQELLPETTEVTPRAWTWPHIAIHPIGPTRQKPVRLRRATLSPLTTAQNGSHTMAQACILKRNRLAIRWTRLPARTRGRTIECTAGNGVVSGMTK